MLVRKTTYHLLSTPTSPAICADPIGVCVHVRTCARIRIRACVCVSAYAFMHRLACVCVVAVCVCIRACMSGTSACTWCERCMHACVACVQVSVRVCWRWIARRLDLLGAGGIICEIRNRTERVAACMRHGERAGEHGDAALACHQQSTALIHPYVCARVHTCAHARACVRACVRAWRGWVTSSVAISHNTPAAACCARRENVPSSTRCRNRTYDP